MSLPHITLHLDTYQKINANLADVEVAVKSLDGAERTLVLIELPSGRTLTVGGGPDLFVTEIAESDTLRWAAIDPTSGDGTVDLVVGGQLVDYPARVCVNRITMLKAARTFVKDDGNRDPAVMWSRET